MTSPTPDPATGQSPDVQQEGFAQRLASLTPVPWALYLVVALNVSVWLINVATGVDALKPSPADMLRWGANSASSVTLDHEYWRLLTATTLHGGALHLALNMLGLWSAGLVLNRLFGNRQFLLIYLGSALVGSALSLHFSSQTAVSVGASGAVFGVLGALLVSVLQHRDRIPALVSRQLMGNQIIFISFALVQGFASSGIDNAAHVGGLLAGVVLAWLLVERLDVTTPPGRRTAMAALGTLLCAGAVIALTLTTPPPQVHHRERFAFQQSVQRLLPALRQAETRLQADAQRLQQGKLEPQAFIQAMERDHLPAWRALSRAIAPLHLPATDGQAVQLRDLRRQTDLVIQMMELEVRRERQGPQPGDEDRMRALTDELRALSQRQIQRSAAAASQPR